MSAPESDLSGSIETVLQGASALPSVSLYVFLGSVIGLVFLVIPVAPPIIFSECSCTTQLFAPAGGLCTACRNQPTTTTNKSVFLWGGFPDLSGISGHGAHHWRFCPGFPGMVRILWGFVQDFRGWGASCEVLSRISIDGPHLVRISVSTQNVFRISVSTHKFL